MTALSVKCTKAPKICMTDDFPEDAKEMIVESVFMKVMWHHRLVCKEWYVRFYKRLGNGTSFHIPFKAMPRESDTGRVRDYQAFMNVDPDTYKKVLDNPRRLDNWPCASTVDPAAIVVVAGVQKGSDNNEIGYTWYVRLRVVKPEGQKLTNFEVIGQHRLRRLPSKYCDKILLHICKDRDMIRSSLVTKYQPNAGNPFMVAEKNGWKPKIIAQTSAPKEVAQGSV